MTTLDRQIISLSQELSALKQKFVLPFRDNADSDFYNLNKSTFFISEFVLTEARNVIARKFSNKISENMLFSFIGATPITVVSLPKKNELKKFMAFVEEKDTPILASSLKYCDILLTLDKEILEANSKIKNLEITTPGELI